MRLKYVYGTFKEKYDSRKNLKKSLFLKLKKYQVNNIFQMDKRGSFKT